MSLNQLQLGTALAILFKTTPIMMIRLGAYLAFWTVLVIYLGLVGGIAYLLAQLWQPLGFIIGLIAFVSTIPIYRLAYRYVFYLLKVAHIAIAAELLQNDALPDNVGQLAWGREQVTSRFGQVSVMFVVDELVQGVVRAFTRIVFSVASWFPGDTMETLARVVNRVVQYATTYVDEAILARAFWRRDETIWHSAEEGLVLYAMVWKPLLANAVALMLLSYVPFIVAVVLLAAPIGFLLSAISTTLAAWSIVFVLILAFFVKVAIGDSFAMISMLASYQRETRGLEPDPAMTSRLEDISEQFRELKNRALNAAGRRMGANGMPGLPAGLTVVPGDKEAS